MDGIKRAKFKENERASAAGYDFVYDRSHRTGLDWDRFGATHHSLRRAAGHLVLGSVNELHVVPVKDQRSRHQTLEVQSIRKELQSGWPPRNGVILLGVGELRALHCAPEAVVNAERQTGHFLGDYHQGTWKNSLNRLVTFQKLK